MSSVAGQLSFEVLRFAAAPVSGEVALLELEGRLRAGTRRRLGVPRLVAEHAEGTREVAPAAADEATAEPDGVLWRASYAVSLDELSGGEFSLAIGRELLVGLPAPDAVDGGGDREVRLAREANALRRTADEARAAASAALASVGDERRAREEAEARVAELGLARDDLTRRVAGVEEELAQARRDHAAKLVRRDEERATLMAGHEAAQSADERVAEIEAEVVAARRDLRTARAEAESYRRELERERERVEAAEASVRRGRVTEIAGEPVDDDPPPTTQLPTAGDAATAEPVEASPGETVRVLGRRRPRRTGEGPPAEAAPGTAEIGARFIEPGQTPRRSAAAAWITRALAFAALAIVIVAILLVLKPF